VWKSDNWGIKRYEVYCSSSVRSNDASHRVNGQIASVQHGTHVVFI
jgi:hypothetical protein